MAEKNKSERFLVWNKELDKLEEKKSKYEWDELEEIITDEFEDDKMSSDEFDELMAKLMKMDM